MEGDRKGDLFKNTIVVRAGTNLTLNTAIQQPQRLLGCNGLYYRSQAFSATRRFQAKQKLGAVQKPASFEMFG